MNTISMWPDRLPPGLNGLGDLISGQLEDCRVELISNLPDCASGTSSALVILSDEAAARGQSIEGLVGEIDQLAHTTDMDMVFVVGDGYLGTDGSHLAQAGAAAATVTLARSLAVRRGRRARANVICVPDSMFGNESSQRSPLPQEVEAADVAATIGYLLGDSGQYVNGQILYLDGGRHLFSSHTS